ncbi:MULTISPECIES: response regulator transcription factor [Sphingosinicellaceae]|uniref:response regulator transcription factor n=1 Tax=Sphingosinicellaceae TaxID=2820280 RepID=UPI001C1DEB3D|nr:MULTISPECIES: response regulator transcription factor [Polymorphobacter]QYE35172.1 response regulator transcription factor [Polymorphobacter sp. PAMC 29334]UAJ11501.1 response regulator transcription factor [Polymorphobacter megasporae]
MLGRSVNLSRKVAIAHQFPLVVEALKAIATSAGFEAAIEATNGARHKALVEADVAVVSIQLGGIDVLKARRAAGVPTIIVFDQPNADALLAAVELAAEGVVLTTSPATAVAACLTAVAAGEQWLDPEATRLIIDRVARPAAPALTRREQDVATLVAAGQRNRAIGDALGISEGTVKMHLHNVYAKLGLESRTQLAMELRARAA